MHILFYIFQQNQITMCIIFSFPSFFILCDLGRVIPPLQAFYFTFEKIEYVQLKTFNSSTKSKKTYKRFTLKRKKKKERKGNKSTVEIHFRLVAI